MKTSTRKTRVGLVLKHPTSKTVLVEIVRITRHPFYGKVMKIVNTVKVHDARDEAKVGDRVCIEESRPLSREKRWIVKEIVERAQ